MCSRSINILLTLMEYTQLYLSLAAKTPHQHNIIIWSHMINFCVIHTCDDDMTSQTQISVMKLVVPPAIY